MKAQFVICILLLSLAACLGALYFQHQRHLALAARQDEAIASLQKKYEALLPPAQAHQKAVAARTLSRNALTQARPLAAKHRKATTRDLIAKK